MSESGDGDATRSQAPAVMESVSTAARVTVAPGDRFVDEPEHYAVEHPIGAGGMGTVVAAKGERFGRSVALKLITVDRDDLRRRFEREAQVTARLQHPAIVPVYGSGRGHGGAPFYAMKQVSGEPLDKVIAGATTLAQRIALLPKVIAVSEAIAYAHAEKVIHRDLKPANILVGAFGETIIIDWGLAKDLGAADDDAVDTVTPYRASGDETAVGKVMGTPAYMPREQARGERVDERADVYALGAILYHVLAGAPPYRNAGEGSVPWETMLARVLSGPPAPLASLQPEVPPDLLAIVTRAMATSPDARYRSAGELADDLEKFQTGQLVGAHRYSTWQLVRRWIRRHRAPLAVAVVALLVLVAGGVLSIRSILQEQARTEEQRVAAEQQRALADKNRASAEGLLSFMMGDLKTKLEPLGKLDLLDAVAKKAVAYYAERGDATDDELDKRAQAASDIADVLAPQGHTTEALAQYQTALALYRRNASLHPDDLAAQRAVPLAMNLSGEVRLAMGDPTAALADYRGALAIRDQLAKTHPGDVDLQNDLSRSHTRIAEVLAKQGDIVGATKEQRDALAISEVTAAGPKANDQNKRDLAVGHTKLGRYLRAQGLAADSRKEFETAKQIFAARVTADPTSIEKAHDLGVLDNSLADLLAAQGDGEAAVALYREIMARDQASLDRDPTNNTVRHDLGLDHVRVGLVLRGLRKLAEALAEDRSGLGLLVQVVAADPANLEWKHDESIVHEKVGDDLDDLKDLAGAAEQYGKSLELRALIAAKKPDNITWQNSVAVAHEKLGDVAIEKDDFARAIAEYQQALPIVEALMAKDPKNTTYETSVAAEHERIGDALRHAGKPEEAIVQLHAALALYEAMAKVDPSDVSPTMGISDDWNAIGRALALAHDRAGAIDAYRRAVAPLDALLAKNGKNAQWLTRYVEREAHLAEALAANGDTAGARAAYGVALVRARERAALDPGRADLAKLVKDLEDNAR